MLLDVVIALLMCDVLVMFGEGLFVLLTPQNEYLTK
jgi:hypothetical protein